MRLTVHHGDATLATETLSQGPIPAVALHAGVADRRSFVPLARALEGTLNLTAYDRRGFGETGYGPEPHRHVDDLAAVVDATVGPATPVWLIGNSQGGRIAVDFALAHPARVAGLILIAPALSGAEDEDDPEMDDATAALAPLIDAAYEAGDHAELNRLEAHLWLDGPTAQEGRVQGALRDLFLDMNAVALNARDPGEDLPPPVPDAAHRLADLVQPTLVLCGDLDLLHVKACCRQIAEQAPRAEPVTVAGCAHLPQLEQPSVVAELVRSFVARSSTPRGR